VEQTGQYNMGSSSLLGVVSIESTGAWSIQPYCNIW
jgi:hypothetical protein